MDEKDLKIMALKERVGEIVSDYEEKVADLRVVVTQQQAELDNFRSSPVSHNPDAQDADEVLEGEVI